ncbi:MAG: glycosyltransferase family 2 protein [Myxococcota bacterium]|nr:glycosyltransferase family 2 protein [Myxococcota bacterium]
MYKFLRIAVVIPALNEERKIGTTIKDLPSFVDHVVVVNDGSDDDTTRIARSVRDHHVTVLEHPHTRGVGAAICTGYRWALKEQFDATVVVGADGQMDPNEMCALLEPLVSQQADYVKGERLSHPQVWTTMPTTRLLGTRLLTWVTRMITGYEHLTDAQCGYTAISQHALALVPLDELYPQYGFPNDLLVKLAQLGLRISETPVTPIYGQDTSKMKIHRVVGPLSWLLAKAFVKAQLRRRSTTQPARLDDQGDANATTF